VLAPVPCTLDNLGEHLDPELAPADIVDWLAGWVGAMIDENWPVERRRAVAQTVAPCRRRGSVRGLAEAVGA